MGQTIAQRLKILAEYEVKQINLAKKIHLTPQAISKTIAEDRMIRSDTLENIACAYPELNMRWFLTGEGESGLDRSAKPLTEQKNDLAKELEMKTKIIKLMEGEVKYIKFLIRSHCPELAERFDF